MYDAYVTVIQELLREKADPKAKVWWEGYVKQSAPFLGVKMAIVRSSIHQWHAEFVAESLDVEQQVDLALTLFHKKHTEEKLLNPTYEQKAPPAVVQEED